MIFDTGDSFERTFIVSGETYGGFLAVFNDHNPLHTDDRFAQEKGFKSKVMHGNILSGFLSYFIGECLPVKNVIIHYQEIHFSNPVYLGQQLEFQATVDDVFGSVGTVIFKFKFTNGDKKVVSKGKIQIGII